jgi:hypothetical protein
MDKERSIWEGLKFPKIKNINARTLADHIESVVPMQPSKIKKQYENHWGELVTQYEGSMFSIIKSTESHLTFGDRGHTFGVGFYVVNERGETIYQPSKEYDELHEKCSTYWEAIGILRSKYRLPEYSVERGRGDRLVVNDKIVGGIRIHPGSFGGGINWFLDHAVEFIDEEIKSGRIKPGEFGRE